MATLTPFVAFTLASIVLVITQHQVTARGTIDDCYSDLAKVLVGGEADLSKKYKKPICEVAKSFTTCVRKTYPGYAFRVNFPDNVFVTSDEILKDAGYDCPKAGTLYRLGPLNCLLNNFAGTIVAIDNVVQHGNIFGQTQKYLTCMDPYYAPTSKVTFHEKKMFNRQLANWSVLKKDARCKPNRDPVPDICKTHLSPTPLDSDGMRQYGKMFTAIKEYTACIKTTQLSTLTTAEKNGVFRGMVEFLEDPKVACDAPKVAGELNLSTTKSGRAVRAAYR